MTRFVFPLPAVVLGGGILAFLFLVEGCVSDHVMEQGEKYWAGKCKVTGISKLNQLLVKCDDAKEIKVSSQETREWVLATIGNDLPPIKCVLFKARAFGETFGKCGAKD